MRSIAGSFIMICGVALAGLRVAVPYPQGILSQVLLERNVHVVMEKLVTRTITSLPSDASQLFVSNLMDMSHMLAIWCQAVLMVLAGYLLSRMVKG
jgi:hypothetical protein